MMAELGGLESIGPDEGSGKPPEQLSEAAKDRFRAQAAAMKQLRGEEKRARKRDDSVAHTIVQFLGEEDHAHLFLLISRLVARDCPSIFILAILSLINKPAIDAVEEYITEHNMQISEELEQGQTALMKSAQLPKELSNDLMLWVTRMQVVMSIDARNILMKLVVENENVDGTVLQLGTFVLSEYFQKHKKPIPFEQLQPLTGSILQLVFEPFMDQYEAPAVPMPEED